MGTWPRHLFGFLVAALLAAALYAGWVWEADLVKKTPFADFRILLALVAGFVFLSLAQWVHDRLPGGDAADHSDEDVDKGDPA